MSSSTEPFDRSYLDALSREGIDLPTFLRGWHSSMDEDLARLHGLREQSDIEGLRASLHRLSGTVGLVGARSLMEALQTLNATLPQCEAGAIEALAKRARNLMMQLDEAIGPHRSAAR
ncbi:Hpt domain-containing protein [Paraburkholderia sediminicola]|uniref:Hpt domain-containing protein n=1 Tax=Paraburkholderia sediminicola TaxID=458836 RepID=UPI0038BC464B